MDKETSSSLDQLFTSMMQQSSLPLLNNQINRPVYNTQSYFNNECNIQLVPSNNKNFNSALNNNSFEPCNINKPFNNMYDILTSTNVPHINESIIPLINPSNTSLSYNNYLHPPVSYLCNNINTLTPQFPNLNGYFSNELLDISNINFNNESMKSSLNNLSYNTLTVPSHDDPLPTTFNESAINTLNNQHITPKEGPAIKEEKIKVDEWFELTSKFLNYWSNNTSQKQSLTSNIHSDLKTSSCFESPKHCSHKENKYKKIKPSGEVSDEINEIKKLSSTKCNFIKQIINYEKIKSYQSFPTHVYYKTDDNSNVMFGKKNALDLCEKFEKVLGNRVSEINALKPTYNVPCKRNVKVYKYKSSSNSDTDDDSSSYYEDSDDENSSLKEFEKKRAHPDRLHPELWYNEPGELNNGPACKCSIKSQQSGIQHNIFIGEGFIEPCLPNSNNADKLFHYRIKITPLDNFLLKCPTVIEKDGKKFVFEGFSLLSHYRIPILPVCKLNRFNTNYAILYIEEKIPENFIIKELQLFYDYLFKDILELIDLNLHAIGNKDGCPQFHFIPRFVRLSGCNKQILSMNDVLKFLLESNKLIFEEKSLPALNNLSMDEWQNIVDEYKGMIVTNPETKPCSIRVDRLDRDNTNETSEKIKNDGYPILVHFGIRPLHLRYTDIPEYQEDLQNYLKFKKFLANIPLPSFEDKRKLEIKEKSLQEMRIQSEMKSRVMAVVSSKGFYRTGFMGDIIQHAMLLPVLVYHFRFHKSLEHLEDTLNYKFKNKYLLQLALTHPSYNENVGTNPDHVRNVFANCGIRQLESGHTHHNKKKGINKVTIEKSKMESDIMHYERLEFLGDAVLYFVSTIHLFNMFPEIEEGGLSTFRCAIVENKHLAFLAKTIKLDAFMLYRHSSDLCLDSAFKQAMANCFEALMGAIFLDGGINVVDRVFSEIFFKNSPELLDIWVNNPKHPLQQQEPEGDRKWIKTHPFLQKLTKFEDCTGIKFNNIRLLARAFTDTSMGFSHLTLGSNERFEFLGDAVLQLLTTDYLYKFFPEHREGHLSILRSSLVSNRTLSIICDDLNIVDYTLHAKSITDLSTKKRADLVEALLGALYIDKGLKHCEVFCNVCFFPRLHEFIMEQKLYDPKTKLNQCCLTLSSFDNGQPDIPVYRVIKCVGPEHSKKYTVAVYFKGVRLSQATSNTIHRAEMNAAINALELSKELFPQLDNQRRAITRLLRDQCSDTEANIDDLIQLVVSNSLKNKSKTSESALANSKLFRELLAVLCDDKSFYDSYNDIIDNIQSEEPSEKKKKN